MNNIFKTIWNKSTQSWVAVSELARGYVKSSSAQKVSLEKNGLSKFSLNAVALILGIVISGDIFANYTAHNGVANGGGQNIAIGRHAQTGDKGKGTNQSIAIGSANRNNEGAWAKGDQSIAIGGNTIAEGHSSIAIGGDDVDKAINERIGYTDNNGGSVTDKLGTAYTSLTGGDLLKPSIYASTKAGHLGVALGVKAVASNLSLALGTNAQASKTNTLAIGAGAIATLDNSVAIGGGASTDGSAGTKQTNTRIEGTSFNWAGGNNVLPGDIVTFGKQGFERQLKNIAPGKVSADSTDAINGSQLYSITQVLTKRSQRDVYVHVNTGVNTQEAGNNSTNAGQIDSKGGATGTKSATLGVNAKATAENAIAIGTDASASKQNSVALGSGAQTIEVSTDNSTKFFTTNNASGASTNSANFAGLANSTNGSVSFGSVGKERQLHNVAAGRITATSTDAINGSQLYHVAKNLGFNIYQGNTPKSRINNDGVVKFVDGAYTTVAVTPENGNAKVTFNVKTSTIDASTMSVTGNDTGGLAKSSDVVAAIKASGFTLNTDGANSGDNKVKHGSTLSINQGDGIAINRNTTTFTVGLNPETKTKIDNIGTGNVAVGDNKTVTGGAVHTAIKNAVDAVHLTFEGDNSAKGNVVLKDGSLKIKGDNGSPIETASSTDTDTLILKIKDTSIETKYLKDGAVTTDKIADGSVTLAKLNQDAKDEINKKEESVDATQAAEALGLTVSEKDRIAENKGKLFTIDLNHETLINKLSQDANISSPTKTSPKLVTDAQVKDYISNTPIKLIADNLANPDANNKVGLGGTLSIKGAAGSLITTSVNGSDFTLDLTQDTKNKINLIGTGNIAAGQQGTVTGDKVHQAIDSLTLKIAGDVQNGDVKLTNTLNIKGANDSPVTTEFNDADDTLSIKIKDSSIQEKHLAPNAVTTGKIADGAITSAKLGADVNATINAKEESVDATTDANNLGLTVTSKDVQGKGKLFTIDLKSETLISKLSENAQIGGTAANKLITDAQLNTYLNSNPLKFQGNVGDAISRKLGEALSIIGKDGVNTLNGYTDENIATQSVDNKVIIKFKEVPEFKSVKFKKDNNEVIITPTADGLNFTKSGTDTKVKLDNLADADLSSNSKQAVTGSQLHSTNERINSLEEGWQIAGNDLQKVQDIKKGTNKVNFVNSKNIDATVILRDDGANVSFTAKTQDITVDNKTGTITTPTDSNSLITAKSVADALSAIGWVATSDKVDSGEVIGKSSVKVSSGDTVSFKAGKNLKVAQDGTSFTYSTLDNVNFNNVVATESIGIASGPKLSTTGLDMADKKITNLADGEITDASEDAVTGKQLKDLADKLGITPNTTTNTKFDAPVFPNTLTNADKSVGGSPTSLLDAVNKSIIAINRGLIFGGDKGTPETQYLGSKFDIKAATENDVIDNKFVGKNLKTKYVNTNGNGLLSIGLSDIPDFKKITLTDGNGNNVQPYLTLEKDGTDNTGKISGLSERDATKNIDYGKNGNANRAATEGAVKELSDRVKQADDKSPFVYSDDKGNVLTKANDGKFYPVSSVNSDGTVKTGEDSKNIEPENVVVKVKDATPMPITNVRSGLGLDGKAENGATEGTPESPKAISVDKAKNVIAGNGGLLSKEGAELNKVSTIGDLQALAQAGLDFSGNKGDVIHRPLGTKLEILGKDGVHDLTAYSSENIATETKDNKLYIRFKDKPEFKGITVKDSDDKTQIELTPENGLVVKANKDDATPVKITSSGIDAGDSKVTNLDDGNIADNSKDAVTGKQLKNLADKLGVEVDTANNSFSTPIFKDKIKNADGTDTNVVSPTTFKGAIDNVISALNRGIGFIGDIGNGTQYLGSTFAVKAAEATIDNKFVGKNLKTSYTKGTDGNGVLSIGLSETPDFKKITLTDGENNNVPYLTLEKDGAENTGKITGLTDRNPTNNADNYGKNGNEGRAATEGAVKELSDRVNQGDKNSPFVYEKADGTKITKATDGKFYPADKVNADGTKKDDAVEVPANEVVVKVNDKTPMPITNVRSGLGLDGKSDTDPTIGSQSEPKAISADKAKTAIAGKDGKSGLLSKEGADLNKVSTIGDLQALAQAGLDFAGNKGTVIHRPLGTKLEILGNASIKDDELAKFSIDNIVTETKDDKLYIKFKDIPKLRGLELNSGNPNAKSITISPDDTGSKLSLTGGDTNGVTLDGLKNAEISENSQNAVTGNQLKDLADKLGVEVSDDKSRFKAPEFTAIKDKNGADTPENQKPTTLTAAVNKTIDAVNRGLSFAGDDGKDTQYLGSTFNVKSVTEGKELDVNGKKFVGKNITTKYEKDADGNGTLSIGISDKPDFEAVTLTKKGETTPFLTIGEDTENTDKPTTGKITGLTARDLGSKGYGVGDNVGRAATEGAVKDLYDKVKSNESSSPFEYKDNEGNKLVKVGDNYYSEGDLKDKHIVDGKIFDKPVVKDGDKYYVTGPDGRKTANEATPITVAEKTPATASNKQLTDISNVRSGLGLDGKSETNSVDGSPVDPKAISTEKAKEVIAGKDGKSGLLTTEGAPLNKVATIGDLQAVAKAGLTFKGNNNGTEVHRPLGTTLDIKGEATDAAGTSGKNVYVEANANDNSLTVKIKETPEFKGLELKDQNANSIKFTPSDADSKDDPGQKEPVLTLSSGTGPNNTVKLTGISDGDISPTSKDAVNGSQVFALSRGEVPKTEDKHITITQPDGSTTVIDAKNVIVDEKGNPLLKTYNVQGQGEHIENSVISAISNMNTEGIKFFHTNDGRKQNERPQEQGLNEQDSSAGGVHSTAVGYRANAAGMNGIAFGSDAVAGKILEEKEVTITERVNGKDVVTKRKVRVVEGVKNAIAIGAGARASNDNTISIGSGNQVNGKNSGAIGDPSYINADNSYAIGNNNKIETTSEKTFVLGNEVTVTTARSVFLGDAVGYVTADNKAGTTKGNAEYSEQKIGETTYKYAGGKANEVVGVVSVGNVSADGSKMETRRIQNVAPGLISDKSTDAINGSQLYAVIDSGWNLKAEEVDGTSGKVTKGKADTTKVSIGKTVKVRAGNNVEIAHNKDESIDISTSMAPTFNSLNVNPGGTVNMGGNRVQNVGNAVEAGDAVNYGQFKAEVGKLDSRLQAGIAGAVASGTLVQAFNPNESLVAVGAGTYRGKSAVALGYSRVSDNGKIIIKVTGSTNTYGDVTGGASVGYKF